MKSARSRPVPIPWDRGKLEVFRVVFTANEVGVVDFLGDPADESPAHDMLYFDPPEVGIPGRHPLRAHVPHDCGSHAAAPTGGGTSRGTVGREL